MVLGVGRRVESEAMIWPSVGGEAWSHPGPDWRLVDQED